MQIRPIRAHLWLRLLRLLDASASIVIDPAALASAPAAPRLILGTARIIALRLPRHPPAPRS
jgi:hypothetical protein